MLVVKAKRKSERLLLVKSNGCPSMMWMHSQHYFVFYEKEALNFCKNWNSHWSAHNAEHAATSRINISQACNTEQILPQSYIFLR